MYGCSGKVRIDNELRLHTSLLVYLPVFCKQQFELFHENWRIYKIGNTRHALSLFLASLCQGWGAARNFFTASSDSVFHPPLSPVFFFQSSSSPAFLTSLLTQSSHLSIGLPRLLLPCSHNSAALFGSLSSAILSTCPAHCHLLLTSLSVKLLCTRVSSVNSTILRLSALVTLAIFRTQLFSHTCSLCCCSSVSAKVSVPYRHAGVTHVLIILPFSPLEICWSAIPPSTALHAIAPACTLRRTSLSVFPAPHTAPPRYTKLSPWVSFSSPARCPALPSGGLCAAPPSSLR